MTKNVKDTLNAIKRAIVWSKSPNSEAETKSGIEAEFGMPISNEATCKSAIEVLYAIVSADGVLGNREEAYIINKLKDLQLDKYLNDQEFQNVMQFKSEVFETAKSGGYKGKDIAALINTYAENLKGLGFVGDTQQVAAKAILCTSIAAASADGFAPEEQEAAQTFADLLHIKQKDLSLINKFVKLEERFDSHPELVDDTTFNSEVTGLYSEIADFS